LKIPAPTIEPMTMAVSDESGSFPSAGEATEGDEAPKTLLKSSFSLPF
jgi:hypothetical protein